MKPVQLKTWKRDPDASRWILISIFGFLLRYPNVSLTAESPASPKGPKKALAEFGRYGAELRILEDDLTECVNEFQQAYERLYQDPENLELKKFAVVYHLDNFYVRVHKYVENIYRTLALVVGLDPTRRQRPGELPFRERVRNGLGMRQLAVVSESLRGFEDDKWLKGAVDARNLFVHQYREEPEWPMLHPSDRFLEPEDSLARDLRRIEQGTDLDRYAARKTDELLKTMRAIRRFRDKLYDVLHEALLDRNKGCL
jgi:hypothetical protein